MNLNVGINSEMPPGGCPCSFLFYVTLAMTIDITLFRSMTMFCGIDIIMWNISHIQTKCGEYFAKYCQSHRTLL